MFFFVRPQFIPQITSLNPITSVLPLLFVLSVTAVKDGVDDYVSIYFKSIFTFLYKFFLDFFKQRRHQSDKKVNNKKVTVIRNGKEVEASWANVIVGDIVLLKKDDAVTVINSFLLFNSLFELKDLPRLTWLYCLPANLVDFA